MAKVLVAGGLFPANENPALHAELEAFSQSLGRQLIRRGHVVMGGCRSALDAVVATAAAAMAEEHQIDPRAVVRSWVSEDAPPSHQVGEITRSRVTNWAHVPRRFAYPEPIREADVVIIVGGREGTHYAASWARLANKPLVPVAAFGLAAAEIFDDEIADLERRHGTSLRTQDYEILNRALPKPPPPDAIEDLASDVVVLAERLIASTEVFVIMSFGEQGHLEDAYDTFCQVCEQRGLRAFKVDEHTDPNERLLPAVMDSIRRSAFIIADVSEPRPNVYYELGYAQALGKLVITTAFEGTRLPFDIFDVPTLFWSNQRELRNQLEEKIRRVQTR